MSKAKGAASAAAAAVLVSEDGGKTFTLPSGQQVTIPAHLPFDKYVVVEMKRRDLHAAPYNPRTMTDAQKKRLRAGLKKHGMLQPPIWNVCSGHVVGGHQRLSQLDALFGSMEYSLQVAVCYQTEAEEKESNILLNNPSAQGDWDLERLEPILHDPSIDLAGTGFDAAEVLKLLGDMPGNTQAGIEDLASRLKEFQEAYQKVSDNDGRDDFYLVVVFRDYAMRLTLFKALGLEDNRYQDGIKLLQLLQSHERELGGVCTFVDCGEDATTPMNAADGSVWADLCYEHAKMTEEAIAGSDSKLAVDLCIKAQGGSKFAARREARPVKKHA